MSTVQGLGGGQPPRRQQQSDPMQDPRHLVAVETMNKIKQLLAERSQTGQDVSALDAKVHLLERRLSHLEPGQGAMADLTRELAALRQKVDVLDLNAFVGQGTDDTSADFEAVRIQQQELMAKLAAAGQGPRRQGGQGAQRPPVAQATATPVGVPFAAAAPAGRGPHRQAEPAGEGTHDSDFFSAANARHQESHQEFMQDWNETRAQQQEFRQELKESHQEFMQEWNAAKRNRSSQRPPVAQATATPVGVPFATAAPAGQGTHRQRQPVEPVFAAQATAAPAEAFYVQQPGPPSHHHHHHMPAGHAPHRQQQPPPPAYVVPRRGQPDYRGSNNDFPEARDISDGEAVLILGAVACTIMFLAIVSFRNRKTKSTRNQPAAFNVNRGVKVYH
ncbi:hypothetical protein COB21_00385 [Candidatus Aerophobetes bacterium]|uniref:Uncharacterized protein n=1 Tax=Aerophobetes bacterium TaxID=2030807 RepID=A0A2A4X7P6_UNCAE|nr:MAG: hypothetical protein COB21_00385 [Candidatus Aerophobetes bacterium]